MRERERETKRKREREREKETDREREREREREKEREKEEGTISQGSYKIRQETLLHLRDESHIVRYKDHAP